MKSAMLNRASAQGLRRVGAASRARMGTLATWRTPAAVNEPNVSGVDAAGTEAEGRVGR